MSKKHKITKYIIPDIPTSRVTIPENLKELKPAKNKKMEAKIRKHTEKYLKLAKQEKRNKKISKMKSIFHSVFSNLIIPIIVAVISTILLDELQSLLLLIQELLKNS